MREQPLSLTPNGKGAQCYFRKEFLEDAVLDPGDKLRAVAVDAGVLLVPQSEPRGYRVEGPSARFNPYPQDRQDGDLE